ncbi:hypothetical protein Thiowin_01215 [Thiorhodovibrio winogradskyi]|uniref:Uncharacterized protein n=1 Tax=Thiorhodovibrio winogradskyi TaxID=77007 RepID=A0ABZ0S5K2_9GAMM|nr:hypothetical protein [Thiorhodovibrio winogradskyi]
MIEAPIYLPLAPTGRPTGSERLGLGQVAVRPETARALNAPEEGSAKAPFSERQAAIDSNAAQQQPGNLLQAAQANRSFVELGARARVAASREFGGDSGDESDQSLNFSAVGRGDEEMAAASSAMRHCVEVAVRLALQSEEPHRQFNILV